MLKDSKGNKSLTATFSIVAFVVVLLKFLFSGAGVSLGSFSYQFGQIDAGSIAALLGVTLGAYTARRHTEAKLEYEKDRDTGSAETGPMG